MVSLSFSVASGVVPIYYLGVRKGKKIKVYSFKNKRHFLCAVFSLAVKYSVPFRVLSLKDYSAFREVFLSDSLSLKRTKEELEVRGVLFHFSSQKEFKSKEEKEAYDKVKVVPLEVQKVIKTLLFAPSNPLSEDKVKLLKEVYESLNCPKSLEHSVRYFVLKGSVLEELKEEELKGREVKQEDQGEVKKEPKKEDKEDKKEEGERKEGEEKEREEGEKREGKGEPKEETKGKTEEKKEEKQEKQEKQEKPKGEKPKGRKLKVVLPEVFLLSCAKVAPIVSFEEYLLVDEDEREIFSFLSFFFGRKKAFELLKLYNGNENKFKSLLENETKSFLEKLQKQKVSKLKRKISPAKKEKIKVERPKEGKRQRGLFGFLKSFLRKKVESREVGIERKKQGEEKAKVGSKYALGKKRERREVHLAFCKVLELRIKACLRRNRRKATAFFHTFYSILDCPYKKELEQNGEVLFDESFVSYKERVLRPLESFLGDAEGLLEKVEKTEGIDIALVVEKISSLPGSKRFLDLFLSEYKRELNLWRAFVSSAIKFFKEEGNEEAVKFFSYLNNSFPVIGELTPTDLLFRREKHS